MTNLTIDLSTLINWIISGLIGLIFGVIGTALKYRFDRQRDDFAWERKLEEMRRQWEHESEVHLKRLIQEQQEKERDQIRADLTGGLDTITKATAERIVIHRELLKIKRIPHHAEEILRKYVSDKYSNLAAEQQVVMYQTIKRMLEFMSPDELEDITENVLELKLSDWVNENLRTDKLESGDVTTIPDGKTNSEKQ